MSSRLIHRAIGDRPPSLVGMIHGNAALVAIAAFPAAALSGLALAATLSLIAFAASLLPVFVRPGPPILFGLSERVLTVVYVAWLALSA